MEILLARGDIAQQETEAIVNAANNRLWMGAGVAGAIKRAGGREIEEEAVAKGPIPIGEAVVTGAGRLKARYVIHAAVMGQDLRTDAAKIRQATESSLRRADELGLKSIALPALGTGVGGFSLEECARIMLDVARRHGASGTSLERVVFVLYDEPAYRAFERIWRTSGNTGSG
ncbi:MAG: macro domain-containing protein [Dehalococcoidia bacterium]